MQINNINIRSMSPLISPSHLKQQLAADNNIYQTVAHGRSDIQAILTGRDPRLLVVCGPCSIHDVKAAYEYAQRLMELKTKLSNRLCIVMRTYFEKPRTTLGWTGLIYDPHMDGSGAISTGLHLARQLLLDINALGLPTATEFLDPLVPQFIADLIAWAAIGARTTESQTHRQMASGLSMPVGFKNSTDGNLQIAINALQAAQGQHTFIGIDNRGQSCLVNTLGNKLGHIILRGGSHNPNYDADSINQALAALRSHNLPAKLMVDCSHANSAKQYKRQINVCHDVVQQRVDGNAGILGVMLESNLESGKQSIDARPLKYGVSITDACIGWQQTEDLLLEIHTQLACCETVKAA